MALAISPRPPLGVTAPAPRPWRGDEPIWRRVLQLRRNALPTWGPLAYEAPILDGPFLGRSSFLLNDPGAIRRVLVEAPENYGRTPATIRILAPMIGEGLFLTEGQTWKFQRRTTAPAFAPRNMAIVARTAAAGTDRLIARLQAGRAPDRLEALLPRMQHLALEVAGEALFSQSMLAHVGEVRAALDAYGRHFGKPSPLDFVLGPQTPTPLHYLRRRLGGRFGQLIDRIMAEREAAGLADPPRDLFDALMTARDPESGRGFSRPELRDQIATLIIAGHETTALALFWSLYLLTLAPDMQAAVAAEARGLDLSPAGAPDALDALPLARAVVSEALRLYPPAFTIVRQALIADEVAGRPVRPGALMVISPWVLHRHKQLWDQPQLFDPGRFLPGAPPPPKFAYLPFGAGPRVCIGAQFALTEAVIVLAKLVRAFEIDIPKGKRVLPVGVVTIYPDRSPLFRLRPR